ncbi:MAG: orotate phosphoribosyltransferase [Bacteroidales bacterium]|nr:orotate phosphoribosyltransferase [Bacteroidales bacterium]
MDKQKQVAKYLLQIKAIKLEPANPFTWASGWRSPIYCDNRKTLSFPEVRKFIKNQFIKIIKDKFPGIEVIAGIATGAIAHGAIIAEQLNLPFIYIRSAPKDHGLENLIEGNLEAGQKVVIIEDLISTGKSSIKAVEAVRYVGGNVLGLCAIFTYGFEIAENNFINAGCKYYTLTKYDILIDEALNENYINKEDVETLKLWRKSPDAWGK